MRLSRASRYFGVCAAAFTIGCGSSPTEPDPVYELKTETHSGSLATGGSSALHFAVVNPGNINVSITQLNPNTLIMGLELGSWDEPTSACVGQLSTSTAALGVVFTGTPESPGEYCVAIKDVGNVQTSADFTLTVTHY